MGLASYFPSNLVDSKNLIQSVYNATVPKLPFLLLLPALILAGCDQPEAVQRVDLREEQDMPAPFAAATPAPDLAGAQWRVAADGKGIDFAVEKQRPLLTLHCTLAMKAAPQLVVIHHAQSEPGAKALFAVMGNGMTSRLKLDARLARAGWRWEGTYPAAAPEMDVFTGPRDLEATLPGGGTLKIAASTMPREFVHWCRNGGQGEEKREVTSNTSPAEPTT